MWSITTAELHEVKIAHSAAVLTGTGTDARLFRELNCWPHIFKGGPLSTALRPRCPQGRSSPRPIKGQDERSCICRISCAQQRRLSTGIPKPRVTRRRNAWVKLSCLTGRSDDFQLRQIPLGASTRSVRPECCSRTLTQWFTCWQTPNHIPPSTQ